MGGIGDVLLTLPSIKKLSSLYNVDLLLRNDNCFPIGEFIYDICKYNPYVNDFIVYEDFISNNYQKKYDDVVLSASFYLDQDAFFNRPKKRYEVVANQLGTNNVKSSDINIFLQKIEIERAKKILSRYKKHIIIQATRLRDNYTNEGKTISVKTWENIFKAFPDITFIQLGSEDDNIEFNLDNVFSLIGKTTIRESIALISCADFFILPDSYLNHAAGGLGKKGISFFGSTSPLVYGYPSCKNIWINLGCNPCRIQDPNYMYDQKPCCMRYTGIPIDAQKFIELISEEF